MAKKKTPRSAPARRRAAPAPPGLGGLLREMGVLRGLLALGAILLLVSAPSPGTPAVYSGWAMLPTLIVPVLAPILLQVLLLDALMGRVLMGSASGAARARYRRIVTVNLVLSAVLVAYWTPYFVALARP